MDPRTAKLEGIAKAYEETRPMVEAGFPFDAEASLAALSRHCKETPSLILPIGMQGSGKSTFLKKYFPDANYACIDELATQYIESRTEADEMRATEYMEETGAVYFDWRTVGLDDWLDRELRRNLSESLSARKSLALDGLWSDRKQRQKYSTFAQQVGAYVLHLWFDVHPNTCSERIRERFEKDPAKFVPLGGIHVYWQRFASPVQNGKLEDGADLLLILDENSLPKAAVPQEELKRILA